MSEVIQYFSFFLVYYTLNNGHQIHPCCGKWHDMLQVWVILRFIMKENPFIHPCTLRLCLYLCYCKGMQIFLQGGEFISFGYKPTWKMTGNVVDLFLIILETTILFSKMAAPKQCLLFFSFIHIGCWGYQSKLYKGQVVPLSPRIHATTHQPVTCLTPYRLKAQGPAVGTLVGKWEPGLKSWLWKWAPTGESGSRSWAWI